jgi:hypothetical protein
MTERLCTVKQQVPVTQEPAVRLGLETDDKGRIREVLVPVKKVTLSLLPLPDS